MAVRDWNERIWRIFGGSKLGDGDGIVTKDQRSTRTNIAIQQPADKELSTDSWGRQKVAHDNSLLHGLFTYNVPASYWYEKHAGVEQTTFTYATSVNGELNLTSNGLNEKIELRTFRNPRYEPNRGMSYATSVFLDIPSALGERSFGVGTEESGMFFRLRAGILYAVRRSTTVAAGTVDVEEAITLPDGLDLSNGNIYDIQAQWRGVGNIYFYINQILVHSMLILGNLDNLSCFNPATPIMFECINQGASVTLRCGCVDVTSEGGEDDGKIYGAIPMDTLTGSVTITGYNAPVLAVRNVLTFNGKVNTRDIQALAISAYTDAKSFLRIWVTRDFTAITPGTQPWVQYGNGSLEYIIYAPGATTPMTFNTAKAVATFGSRVNIDDTFVSPALFDNIAKVMQTPGDMLIFTMHRDNGTGADVGVTYEFAEAV